jgi:hypothetical protein
MAYVGPYGPKGRLRQVVYYYQLTLIPDQLAPSVRGPEKAGVGGSIPSLATITVSARKLLI